MNIRLTKLRKRHHYVLEQKGLNAAEGLIEAVRLDLIKAYQVLLEIHDRTAAEVISKFFADHPIIIPQVLPHLDQYYLHHLGFQVHEPHDLVLPGFYRWLPRFSRWLGVPMQINGTLRFPSSLAFQERVGAYAEMMQIWVEVAERELLIEMFDIHKPRELTWLPVKQALNFTRWSDWCRQERSPFWLPDLLAGDDIWHYGIHVRDKTAVANLHTHLQQFIIDKDQYRLTYRQPVLNPRDTSFHTKIRNEKSGLEIEFLTQNLGGEL